MSKEDAYLAIVEGGDSRASMGTGPTKEAALANLMVHFPETFGKGSEIGVGTMEDIARCVKPHTKF